MSVKAMAEVWECSEATGNARLVLLAIADHVNPSNGIAWPSIRRLSEYCKLDRSNVIRNINALIKMGELVKESGEGRQNTRYRITLYDSCGRGGATSRGSATSEVAEARPLQSRRRDTNRYITVNDPLNNIKGDFDSFWQQYPKKVGKGAAKTAYGRALKKVSHDEIMAGLARYNPDPKFTCNPSTWLSQERWTDEHTHIAEQSADAERIGRTATAFEKAATYFRQRDASPDMGDRRDDQPSRGTVTALVDGSGMDRSDDDLG